MELKKTKNIWVFIPTALFFIITLNYRLSAWLFSGYNLYDVKRISELFLLVVTCFILMVFKTQRKTCLGLFNGLSPFVRLLILCIFLLGATSSALAAVPRMALLNFALYFLLLYFAFFIASQRILLRKYADKVLLTIIVIGALVYIVTFFKVYIECVYAHKILDFFPGFANLRFFSQYQIWTLPLITLPIFFFRDKNIFIKLAFYFIAAVWWSLAMLDGSRGLLLALFFAFIFVAIFYRKCFWLRVQGQVVLLGFILYWCLSNFLVVKSSYVVHGFLGSGYTRMDLWRQAVDLIIYHPWLGVGPMHFAYFHNPIAPHPHNSILLLASEWGLPVACFALILCVRGIICWLKEVKKNTEEDAGLPGHEFLPVALITSFTAGVLYSLLSGVLVMPLSQVMLSLVVGWMLGLYYQKPLKDVSIASQVLFVLCILLSLTALAVGVLPDVLYISSHEIKWIYDRHFNQLFCPRFWFQGWLS